MSLINWSEISRVLCNDRTRITKDYSGKKYKEVVKDIKKLDNLIKIRLNDFNK